jgi:hypothetical protein
VLAEKPDRTGLGALLAHFLRKCHAYAWLEAGKGIVEDAVPVEVDFTSVLCFEKTVALIRSHLSHRSDWLSLMSLDLPANAPRFVLKTASNAAESIVDGKDRIRKSLILRRGPFDCDLSAVRKRKMDIHVILASGLMMLTRRLHDDAARGDAAKKFLKAGNLLLDQSALLLRWVEALEIDLGRYLHDDRSCFAGITKGCGGLSRLEIKRCSEYPTEQPEQWTLPFRSH